jgi:hypothetical protein
VTPRIVINLDGRPFISPRSFLKSQNAASKRERESERESEGNCSNCERICSNGNNRKQMNVRNAFMLSRQMNKLNANQLDLLFHNQRGIFILICIELLEVSKSDSSAFGSFSAFGFQLFELKLGFPFAPGGRGNGRTHGRHLSFGFLDLNGVFTSESTFHRLTSTTEQTKRNIEINAGFIEETTFLRIHTSHRTLYRPLEPNSDHRHRPTPDQRAHADHPPQRTVINL